MISGSRPEVGSLDTLYIDPTAHTISYWNGSSYDSLEIPFGTAISGEGDDAHLATTKAVVNYVGSKLTELDAGAVEARVDTLETGIREVKDDVATIEGQIATINGAEEGSIKKALSDAKSYTDSAVANKANTEHTHEIDNVTGLQDALKKKADKATNLAGYGITDAYTKEGADTKIAEAIAAAPHLKRSIVEHLPEVGAADQNTIYMVGTGAGSEDSAYEEYMLINGAFEKIGSSKVDLVDYSTKEYADQVKADAISTAASDATSKANTAEQNAKKHASDLISALDVEDAAQEGKYISAVAEVDGKIQVTRAELPKPAASTLIEGTENGTVKFNGADVAVHGLKSAAYTETSAYATAAQGTKADQVFAALTWQEG